jgi:hypothetical protein
MRRNGVRALVLRHRGIKERDPLEGGMYRNPVGHGKV